MNEWMNETLTINLFWWLTYFKSILTSLQALQCILCLSHISFIRTTPPLRQTQILGATWLATTRVLSLKVRERTLETKLLVLIIYVPYTAISKSFVKSKTSSIKKKKSFVILRTSWYRGSLCRGSFVYKFQILSSLWTGSLFGEINSTERSPLDQMPVHKLNSYCCFYWIYLLKIFFLLD